VGPALIALGGVVLGALLTPLVTAATARQQERRLEARDARIAFQRALGDISEARAAMSFGDWPIGWRVTWRDSWEKVRDPIAVTLDRDDFKKVAAAYSEMRQLQTGLDAGPRPFVATDPPFFEQVTQSLDRAEPVLRDHWRHISGGSPRPEGPPVSNR
jgi:hypothetical protein